MNSCPKTFLEVPQSQLYVSAKAFLKCQLLSQLEFLSTGKGFLYSIALWFSPSIILSKLTSVTTTIKKEGKKEKHFYKMMLSSYVRL